MKTWTKWTPEMIEELENNYAKTPTRELAMRLGVTTHAVKGKAYDLGVNKEKRWTPEMDEELKRDYKTTTRAELSNRFGVSVFTIAFKAKL